MLPLDKQKRFFENPTHKLKSSAFSTSDGALTTWPHAAWTQCLYMVFYGTLRILFLSQELATLPHLKACLRIALCLSTGILWLVWALINRHVIRDLVQNPWKSFTTVMFNIDLLLRTLVPPLYVTVLPSVLTSCRYSSSILFRRVILASRPADFLTISLRLRLFRLTVTGVSITSGWPQRLWDMNSLVALSQNLVTFRR